MAVIFINSVPIPLALNAQVGVGKFIAEKNVQATWLVVSNLGSYNFSFAEVILEAMHISYLLVVGGSGVVKLLHL